LRLKSSFTLLKNNFMNGALESEPAGFAPERTLVLETVGSIQGFYRAVSKIEGLDFLQELISEFKMTTTERCGKNSLNVIITWVTACPSDTGRRQLTAVIPATPPMTPRTSKPGIRYGVLRVKPTSLMWPTAKCALTNSLPLSSNTAAGS